MNEPAATADPRLGLPRLRFSPSPTGFFHVGGARTALWNWLVARRTGGTFILRIEDTDVERNREEWVEGICSAMRRLGLHWHELHRQSERAHLYNAANARLFESGHAYFCDCTSDDVKARNRERHGEGAEHYGYDRHCRQRDLAPAPGRALRFRTPDQGTTTVHDVIRGEPTFENHALEDFVLARGDGSAVFILANVVDDIDMRITHVVRGEEHLPNTPKAILIWQALEPDLSLPLFAHVPVLVNEKRQKLSKRRDKVAVEDFLDDGILPEAMRNYLGLLGWSPGDDREILSIDEMADLFRLEDVSSSPAFFDVVKLQHMNGEYIRALGVDEFVERAEPFLRAALPGYDRERFTPLAPLVQERARMLSEVPGVVDFVYLETPVIDVDAWEKTMVRGPKAVEMLDGVLAAVHDTPWTAAALRELVETVGLVNDLKLGKAQAPVRVAVTGRTVGPPLFEAMEVVGREACIARLRAAREALG